MSAFELIQVSWEAVAANKLRSFLTMLGVAIGSLAIILLISISLGVREQISGVVGGLGSNLYVVLPGRQERGGLARGGRLTVNNLRVIHAEKLQKVGGEQLTVSPVFNAPTTLRSGKFSRTNVLVTGAMPNFTQVRNWPIAHGTFFRQS